MSNLNSAAGGAFAHLLGRNKAAAAGKKAADPEEKDTDAKRAETGDTTDPDDNEDEKKENLDEVKDEKSDPEDGTSDESAKAKKAKAKKAAGDGDEDETDDGDTTEDDDEPKMKARVRRGYLAGVAHGRKAEKARGAAIFASATAADRPDIAAHLAFGTDLGTKAAVDTLNAVGNVSDGRATRRGPGIDERMASVSHPDVGSELQPKKKSATEQFEADFEAAQRYRRGE